MRISVVGWYGKRNVGDEAFQHVLSDFLSGHEVEFVTPPNQCNNPELVILGGGAVASPFYLNILPDCRRYGLGLDLAYESEADLLAAANFSGFCVRNNTDADLLRSKVNCPVLAIPDLAFYIRPRPDDVLGRYRTKPHLKPLGVFVTDYVSPAIDRPIEKFRSRADQFVIGMADKLDALSERGYEIILVPCSTGGYGDDRRINLDLAAFMRNQPTVIMDTLSPQETVDLMKDLSLAICMRFHSHIFGVIAGCPLVSIQFTRKVRNFLEEQSLTDLTAVSYDGKGLFSWDKFDEIVCGIDAAALSERFKQISASYYEDLCRIKQQVRRDWLV